MKSSLGLVKVNTKIALKALSSVLKQPEYLLIALLTTIVILGALAWISNYGLLFSVLIGESGFSAKVSFFLAGYESLFTNFTTFAAISVVLISVLSGVNIAALTYVLNLSKKAALTSGGKNAAAVGAGILGIGCAACGTSILAPLVAGFGAAASLTIVEFIGITANIAAILLLGYSIYRLGSVMSTLQARTNK